MTGPTGRKRRVVVLGAGMAGLMAAQRLALGGLSVTVLDKGRGLGGRMSTRRIEGTAFDHGAQFFYAASDHFNHQVEVWRERGLVAPWPLNADPILNGTTPVREDGTALQPWYVRDGMTRVPKALAEGLDVRTNTRIVRVERRPGGWRLWAENADVMEVDGLIVTIPVPQAWTLFQHLRTDLPASLVDTLAGVRYQPLFSLLLRLAEPCKCDAHRMLLPESESVRWVADNSFKCGAAGNGSMLTVHATEAFSDAMEHELPDRVREALLADILPYLPGEPEAIQLHRWRYAWPVNPSSQPWVSNGPAPVVFAGDGFGGNKEFGMMIEAAALTGLSAAASMYEILAG